MFRLYQIKQLIMTNREEFDANKAFPFKSGSFVGNIIGSAIAVVLFYAVILMRLGSIEHDPWWLQTINFLIVIAAGCAYFLPSYVAFDLKIIDDVLKGKKHRHRWLILLLNLFVGYTLIGWIILLIWSYRPGRILEIPVSIAVAQTDIVNSEKPLKISSEKIPESPEDRLQKLADMKEKDLINEDEFNSKKEEILKEM